MAFNHANVLLLAALLHVAAVGPSAAQSPVYKGLVVGGQLCCSPTGNCPGTGKPVGLAKATLSCTGCNDVVGQDEVNEDGTFIITVASSEKLNFTSPFIPCFVEIKLPTALDGKNCEVLSNTTGTLISGIRSTGTGYMKSLGGVVREATITGFTNHSKPS